MSWRTALAVAVVGAVIVGCRSYGDGYGCGAAAAACGSGPAPGVHAQAEPGPPVEQEPRDADRPRGSTADGGPPATQSPSARAAVYTCPMLPEVVRAMPGPCPKRGMALVAKR